MSAGWCFVCQRDGVVLEEFRQHDGRLAMACVDQQHCCDVFGRKFGRMPRARKAVR